MDPSVELDPGSLAPWDEIDLAEFLRLAPVANGRYRTLFSDANRNGRAYGGQALGHAVRAASLTVPQDRAVSMLQLTFLSGIDPQHPVELRVTPLQDGDRRFSTRYVVGWQKGGRSVFSANVSFASALISPSHASSVELAHAPEDLVSLEEVPVHVKREMAGLGPNFVTMKKSLDVRVPDMEQQLSRTTSRSGIQFWLRARSDLPPDAQIHSAAFAYASDWWLSLSSSLGHLSELDQERPLYISSLNHTIWFGRPFSPTDWMYFECESPFACDGRGLSFAKVYDREGRMLAAISQENLMVPSATA